ncbi:hypothetical protein R2O95_14245, partial [Faecalibacterium duncaniae]|nr:hypothetical protein [Faecalibacterium duncaniae]
PLMLDGIADTTAKYATARANGALNIVFNGIWSRQTEYFTVPSRSDGIGRLRHRKSLVSRKKMRYTMVSCKNIAFFTCCF